MGNFMQSGRGGYGTGGGGGPLNNFHVFGGGSGADSSTPALLDPTEFPSLTNARGQNDQTLPQSNTLQPPGSKPYGNFFTSCEFKTKIHIILIYISVTIYVYNYNWLRLTLYL